MNHSTQVADGLARHAPRKPAAGRRSVALATMLLLGTLVLTNAAQAAGPAKVNTNGPREVSYGSAVLTGSVNPNGSNTSYYFQYGLTRAYGSQTAISDAGSGSKTVAVRLPITGLQPITVYHYRLVAVNSSGATIGDDEKLLTTKVPLSLSIFSSPNPVTFGGTVTVQGTLSGTDNANRVVVLQANPFPYTSGFQSIGNPGVTLPNGEFKFVLLNQEQSTQFRVFSSPSKPVVSSVTTENVAVRVTSHVARTKRRGFARIYGTVTPGVIGAQVGMLRIAQGHGILAGGTVVKPLNSISGQFSRVVRVRKGAYRVLVKVAPGGVVSAYGTPLLIH
ncbi:MAG: hypothetical protein ACYDHT_13710 [Solirubrobacteraceae bacterium]